MQLRKLLNFNNILGLTLPKEYTNAIGVKGKDYVEVYLASNLSIIIKRHDMPPKKIRQKEADAADSLTNQNE